MLFGANDVRNLQLSVVDDRREVVERRAVGTHDVWVEHQRGIPLDVSADFVVDLNLSILRHLETQHPGIVVVEFLLNVRVVECK